MMLNFLSKQKNANKPLEQSDAELLEVPDDILEEEKKYQEGLASVLDLIAPSAMGVTSSHMQIGDVYCRTLFVAAYPSSLNIGWLNPVIGIDLPLDISMFIYPVDTGVILKKLSRSFYLVAPTTTKEKEGSW